MVPKEQQRRQPKQQVAALLLLSLLSLLTAGAAAASTGHWAKVDADDELDLSVPSQEQPHLDLTERYKLLRALLAQQERQQHQPTEFDGFLHSHDHQPSTADFSSSTRYQLIDSPSRTYDNEIDLNNNYDDANDNRRQSYDAQTLITNANVELDAEKQLREKNIRELLSLVSQSQDDPASWSSDRLTQSHDDPDESDNNFVGFFSDGPLHHPVADLTIEEPGRQQQDDLIVVDSSNSNNNNSTTSKPAEDQSKLEPVQEQPIRTTLLEDEPQLSSLHASATPTPVTPTNNKTTKQSDEQKPAGSWSMKSIVGGLYGRLSNLVAGWWPSSKPAAEQQLEATTKTHYKKSDSSTTGPSKRNDKQEAATASTRQESSAAPASSSEKNKTDNSTNGQQQQVKRVQVNADKVNIDIRTKLSDNQRATPSLDDGYANVPYLGERTPSTIVVHHHHHHTGEPMDENKSLLGKYILAPSRYLVSSSPGVQRSTAPDTLMISTGRDTADKSYYLEQPNTSSDSTRTSGYDGVFQAAGMEPAYAFQKNYGNLGFLVSGSGDGHGSGVKLHGYSDERLLGSSNTKSNDLYFLIMVGAFCMMAVAVVLAAGLFAYRLQQNRKLQQDSDYPTYGVVGPNNLGGKCGAAAFVGGYFANNLGQHQHIHKASGGAYGQSNKSSIGSVCSAATLKNAPEFYSGNQHHGSDSGLASMHDNKSILSSSSTSKKASCSSLPNDQQSAGASSKLAPGQTNSSVANSPGAAQSTNNFIISQDVARMYHYQHQKQQMLTSDRSPAGRHNSASDLDSEDENDDGSYTVYECPGLASAHEMEIKNPLFNDDHTH